MVNLNNHYQCEIISNQQQIPKEQVKVIEARLHDYKLIEKAINDFIEMIPIDDLLDIKYLYNSSEDAYVVFIRYIG